MVNRIHRHVPMRWTVLAVLCSAFALHIDCKGGAQENPLVSCGQIELLSGPPLEACQTPGETIRILSEPKDAGKEVVVRNVPIVRRDSGEKGITLFLDCSVSWGLHRRMFFVFDDKAVSVQAVVDTDYGCYLAC